MKEEHHIGDAPWCEDNKCKYRDICLMQPEGGRRKPRMTVELGGPVGGTRILVCKSYRER